MKRSPLNLVDLDIVSFIKRSRHSVIHKKVIITSRYSVIHKKVTIRSKHSVIHKKVTIRSRHSVILLLFIKRSQRSQLDLNSISHKNSQRSQLDLDSVIHKRSENSQLNLDSIVLSFIKYDPFCFSQKRSHKCWKGYKKVIKLVNKSQKGHKVAEKVTKRS